MKSFRPSSTRLYFPSCQVERTLGQVQFLMLSSRMPLDSSSRMGLLLLEIQDSRSPPLRYFGGSGGGVCTTRDFSVMAKQIHSPFASTRVALSKSSSPFRCR